MIIRSAKISDAQAINSLIKSHAEYEQMLHRSMADIYENLQSFTVAEVDEKVVGCCALQIAWSDLAEIKSLAVEKPLLGSGIGKAIVTAIIAQAEQLGIEKVFALTLTPGFFEKMGFAKVETKSLPMKVWSDCAKCPKQNNCDEIAVLKVLNS